MIQILSISQKLITGKALPGEKAVEKAMAAPVSAFGLIFGTRSLSGSPIGGFPETQEISSRKGRFYAAPKSPSQEETPCSVRRKTGYGIVNDCILNVERSNRISYVCELLSPESKCHHCSLGRKEVLRVEAKRDARCVRGTHR
jgi:hypothetical protein